jgi:hypothetical protein
MTFYQDSEYQSIIMCPVTKGDSMPIEGGAFLVFAAAHSLLIMLPERLLFIRTLDSLGLVQRIRMELQREVSGQ